MIKYNPPIEKRGSEELIVIANSTAADWQQDAIDMAKEELIRRGISEDDQQKVIQKWYDKEQKVYEEIGQEMEKNSTQSYRLVEMILIFLLAPLLLIRAIRIGYTLAELRLANFRLKYKQRILLYIGGTFLWVAYLGISGTRNFDAMEEERMNAIRNADISEWEKSYYAHDSSDAQRGSYDSSSNYVNSSLIR